MSIRLTGPAWDLPLPATDKMVLMCLADHADDTGECWPSVPRIARRCARSERQVQAVLNRLESDGWFAREERSGRSSRFVLDVSRILAEGAAAAAEADAEAEAARGRRREELKDLRDKRKAARGGEAQGAGGLFATIVGKAGRCVRAGADDEPPQPVHPRSQFTPAATSPHPRSHFTPPPQPLHPEPSGTFKNPDRSTRAKPDLPVDGDPSVPALTPEHVVELWNGLAGRSGLQAVTRLTGRRRRVLSMLIERQSSVDFDRSIRAIERSAYLRGDTGPPCRFDWWIDPAEDWENFVKVLEGRYDDRTRGERARSRRARP